MTVHIGAHDIGPDHPPFVIAEAGVNHNGDPAMALRLVRVAAESGADAVKFQTFEPGSLATADAEQAAYQRTASAARSQREMLEGLRLPPDSWRELAAEAERREIVFLSTPFDRSSLDLLLELDPPALKVGSGDLTNAPLLRDVGGCGKPVILSTGMGTLAEVEAALTELRAAGATNIVLLHCVSMYPAPIEDLNLRAIDTLRGRFGVPVGFSDHSIGLVAPPLAVAAGAVLIEKHLTLDRSLPGPDHAASLVPAELACMVEDVRRAWSAMGTGAKEPRPGEQEVMRVARRSLVAVRDLPAGHRLGSDDLAARRPGFGVSPMRIDELLGRLLAIDVPADQLLRPGDLDPPLSDVPDGPSVPRREQTA